MTVSHCSVKIQLVMRTQRVSDGVKLQLGSIRHLVSATVFQSLVAALVLCRLDYGNGTLVGLPACLPSPVGTERRGSTGILSPSI